MSYIVEGDKDLHYSDWSHRHLGGNGSAENNALWRSRMAKHMARHRRYARRNTDPPAPRQGIHRYDQYPD